MQGQCPRTRGGGCLQDRRSFFSVVWHASTQHRMPALRGMANQHLWTFERSFVGHSMTTGHLVAWGYGSMWFLGASNKNNKLFLVLTQCALKHVVRAMATQMPLNLALFFLSFFFLSFHILFSQRGFTYDFEFLHGFLSNKKNNI